MSSVRNRFVVAAFFLLLTGCAAQNSQNRYSDKDVGKETKITFGTVVAMREVDITGTNTGTGAAVGAASGLAVGANVGQGGGTVAAAILGAVAGGIAGHVIEDNVQNRKGIEYTVTEENGETVQLVQNISPDDKPINVGDRVMVQRGSRYGADYVRVLPAANMPTKVKKAQGIKAE